MRAITWGGMGPGLRHTAAGAVLLVLGAGVGRVVSYADAQSPPTQLLKACVTTESGEMRLLLTPSGGQSGDQSTANVGADHDPVTGCKKSETLVTWNVVGPKGDTGPQGLKGDPGTAGPAGATGPKGDIGPGGAAGTKGDAGPQGPKGDSGPAGGVGPAGAAGKDGVAGAAGPAGPAGTAGPAGPQGLKGDIGATGATGAKGAQGVAGNVGAAGPQGPKGDTGAAGSRGPAGPGTTYSSRTNSYTTVSAPSSAQYGVTCASGSTLIGGGVRTWARTSFPPVGIRVAQSYPNGNEWVATVENNSGQAITITWYAICAA